MSNNRPNKNKFGLSGKILLTSNRGPRIDAQATHRKCLRYETKHLVTTVDFGYMMEYHTSRKLFWKKRHATKFKVILVN